MRSVVGEVEKGNLKYYDHLIRMNNQRKNYLKLDLREEKYGEGDKGIGTKYRRDWNNIIKYTKGNYVRKSTIQKMGK